MERVTVLWFIKMIAGGTIHCYSICHIRSGEGRAWGRDEDI